MLKHVKTGISALFIGFISLGFSAHAKSVSPGGSGSNLEDSFLPRKAGQDNSLQDMLQPGYFSNSPVNSFEKNCADCYPNNIHGINDNSAESKARSAKEGVAAQYLLGTSAVEEAGVDTEGLSVDLNDFIRVSGAYFKAHPELKGYFRAVFTYFPGQTGKPYQFDNTSAEVAQLNKAIAQGTSCNDKKVCSVFAAMGFSYTNPDNTAQRLDAADFSQFVSQNSKTQNHKFYHTNASYSEPITFILYQGTNGFFIDKELVEADLLRIKNKK